MRFTSSSLTASVSTLLMILCTLLSGCATVIKSDVTAFHEWPSGLQDQTYAFEPAKQQLNNLEYRNYEALVRSELQRVGFTETDAKSARLKVSIQYGIKPRDVMVVQPVFADPWYGPPYYVPPRWHGPGFYRPFYDPFWYPPPVIGQRETQYRLYQRQLRIVIAQGMDGKKLYDVTVNSEGSNPSLAAVMPYMVHSAFVDFPGKSGVPHRVELKVKE